MSRDSTPSSNEEVIPAVKLSDAEETIARCVGPNGLYASAGTYYGQYYLRDLSFSYPALHRLGYGKLVTKCVKLFAQHQRGNDDLPPRIFEYRKLPVLLIKAASNPPLLDLRLFPFGSLRTNDTALHFVLASKGWNLTTESSPSSGSEFHSKALSFLRSFTRTTNGMIKGPDWRDSMYNLRDEFLFCNQVLSYRVAQLLGDASWAERLREKIDSEFWSDALGYYVDYRGTETFDTLGHSLAILFGLVSDSRTRSILKGLSRTLCDYGYRNLWPPYTKSSCGRTPGTYHNGGVWPFVQGYAILALKKARDLGPAHDEVRRMSKLAGFSEWYEPSSGLPRGSRSQLWSAAMFLEAVHGLSLEEAPSFRAGGHMIG